MRRQRLKKQLFTESMSVEGVSGAIYPAGQEITAQCLTFNRSTNSQLLENAGFSSDV